MFFQQFVEGFDAFHADQVEQLLARVGEVLTQIVVHFDTLFRQLGVEHLRHQRNTAAAAGSGFGFRFQRRHGVAAFIDSGDQVAFADVEAGTNLRAVRQFIHADGRLAAAGVGRKDQRIRVFRQLDGIQHQLQQVAVIAGVADQYRAKQGFVIFADNEPFVDLFTFVEIDIATRARRAPVGVADTANVNAEQLQLGAEVGAGEQIVVAEDMVNGNLRHFVAWGDKTVYAVIPAGAFADSVDIRVGGLAAIVDHDAAALGDGETALGSQLVARTDTGREDDEIDLQFATVGEAHRFACLGALLNDLFGVFAGVNFHTHAFNLTLQLLAAHLVELLGH